VPVGAEFRLWAKQSSSEIRCRVRLSLPYWNLCGAIKTAERKLADRTLVHGGQALMAWVVSNARVEPIGNAIVITKQASGTAKIDPLMAALNAVAWMSANPASSPAQHLCDLVRLCARA